MNIVKKLYRSRSNGMLGGVCYGFAEYMNLDPTLVRIGWVLFTALGGAGLLAYLICWVLIPQAPIE